MRKLILFFILGLIANSSSAQKAWLEKMFSSTHDTVKYLFQLRSNCFLYVDLNKTTNFGDMKTYKGPFYCWLWEPTELMSPNKYINGNNPSWWSNSNELLKMTPFDTVNGKRIWRFDFDSIPPDVFFQVDKSNTDYYKFNFNGLCFLVKPKDGGGFGLPDHKTEDICLGNFIWGIGIDKITEEIDFEIYPNPATNSILINSGEKNLSYQIRNSIGLIVMEGIIENSMIPLDISMLNKGIYSIVIQTANNKTVSKKIILQ